MTDDPFLAPPSQQTPQVPPPTIAPATPMAPQPSDAPPPPPSPTGPASYEPPVPYQQSAPPQPPAGYAQPGYAQPGYPPSMPPPMPYYGPQSKPKTWMNWTAFGCGLGAFVTCGLAALPAIIFGHLGLAAAKRGEADQKGVGIAGLVMGYVLLTAVLAYFALMIGLGVSGNLD